MKINKESEEIIYVTNNYKELIKQIEKNEIYIENIKEIVFFFFS